MLLSFNTSTHNMDIEESGDTSKILDHGRTSVNEYATKKTIALTSLGIALLTINGVQLKTLLAHAIDRQTLWLISFILVISSLVVQIMNTFVLLIVGVTNIDRQQNQHRLVCLNNFSMSLSLLVTVINVALNIIIAIDPTVISATNVNQTVFQY